MRTIDTHIDGKHVFGETYNSPQELLNTLASRESQMSKDYFPDGYAPYDTDWFGFVNSRQCKKDFLSANCDPSTLQSIKVDVPISYRRRKTFNSVMGYIPNVPLALMNIPTSMINQKTVLVKNKVINLHVSITADCSYSAEQLRQGGKTLIEYILSLEHEGYRVSLTAYFGSWNHKGELVYIGLKVKDASQPLDVARCAYPFINPSFFRGICFMWYQRTKGFKHLSTLGSPVFRGFTSGAIFEKALPRENRIVLYLTDVIDNGKTGLDEALADIKKRSYNSL